MPDLTREEAERRLAAGGDAIEALGNLIDHGEIIGGEGSRVVVSVPYDDLMAAMRAMANIKKLSA